MQMLFAQSDVVRVTWNSHELKFALREGDIPEYIIRFEAVNDEPVEDWMFEPGYLAEDTVSNVEDWMMDDEYLESEEQGLESWMFDADLLSGNEDMKKLEPWMFDANYLSK
jgi:hypothetical protein